jgi:hypothetical protein
MKIRSQFDLLRAALLSSLGIAGLGCGGAVDVDASETGFPCRNPSPVGGGYEQCDGFMHRASIDVCSSSLPRPDPLPLPEDPFAECNSDLDCTKAPNGYCWASSDFRGCRYGCLTDSDCSASQICTCGGPVGECIFAECTSDADCGAGLLCRSYGPADVSSVWGFACQTAQDQCGSSAECFPGTRPGHCASGGSGTPFTCYPRVDIDPGRPFFVDGVARTAKPTARGDWCAPKGIPHVGNVAPALRARVSQAWLAAAQMEHASIAAFARFALQLWSVGAPPELIDETTLAMRDEIRHAEHCFAVASAYAGRAIGPEPLAVDGSLNEMSLKQCMLATVREGCIGETIAAFETREASEHVRDPELRKLLRQISADETRHAQLAFRFLNWALEQGGSDLHRALEAELSRLRPTVSLSTNSCSIDDDLLEHGILPERARGAIRAQVITHVVRPCLRAVLRTKPDGRG